MSAIVNVVANQGSSALFQFNSNGNWASGGGNFSGVPQIYVDVVNSNTGGRVFGGFTNIYWIPGTLPSPFQSASIAEGTVYGYNAVVYFVLSGLDIGQTYSIQTRYFDVSSTPINFTLSGPAPWKPNIDTVQFTPTTATVNWTYDRRTGVEPTSAQIEQINAGLSPIAISPSTQTYTWIGTFTPGTTYTFRVQATSTGATTSGSGSFLYPPIPALTGLSVTYDPALKRTNIDWTLTTQQNYQGATVSWNNGAGDSGSQQASGSNLSWPLFLKGGNYTISVSVGSSTLTRNIVVPGELPPIGEVKFTVINSKEGQATIQWSYPSKYFANFVSFSAAPSDNSFILMQRAAELTSTQTSYTLTGLKPNVSYSYVLTLNNTLTSINYPGQPFIAISPPPALTNLTASYLAGSAGQVKLEWRVTPADARPPWFTEVQAIDNNGEPFVIAQSPSANVPPPATATITLSQGEHNITVLAVGQGGKSSSSNIARVTVPFPSGPPPSAPPSAPPSGPPPSAPPSAPPSGPPPSAPPSGPPPSAPAIVPPTAPPPAGRNRTVFIVAGVGGGILLLVIVIIVAISINGSRKKSV